MAITNNFTATIQQFDTNGQTLFRRESTTSDTDATVGQSVSGNLLDTVQLVVTLPVAQVRQVWIHNTDSAGTITVVWTPTTGASVTTIVLGPDDQITFWHGNTGATYGVSNLRLTASVANVTYEMYLGG